ncbi:MAG: SBBP repeat-containing protein, partial [Promethearchaeota archaeon]
MTLELLERGVQVTVHRTSHCTGDSAFTFIDASPILYQSLTRDETISGSFHLFESNMYGFSVPTYDPTRLLIIDPLILPLANPTYSTYIGGRYHDYGQEITVDAAENTYITGYTESTDFPTVNAYDGTFSGGAYDVFVCKLAANGSTLLYSTYIGGSNEDFGQGITIDTAGNAYVTGHTQSTNFPTVNAYDAIGDGSNGFTDVFVCKLAANGSTLLYSTYIGGSNDDQGRGIAVDDLDNAYITGYTWSTDFPTVNAYNDTFSGGANDMFVCKLAANGSTLLYSTYIGGSNDDQAHGIVVNDLGNAYVTGRTLSTDFPTVNAYDATSDGSTYTQDVFVLKLAANGSTLLYSTYISGSDSDNSVRIAIDEAENTYITGYTWSTDFPTTPNAYDPTGDGSTTFENIFICKLAANGSTMLYSTYISGEYIDRAYAIAIDTAGNAYVTGYTGSNDFPTTANAYNSTLGNAWDVFILKLSSDGTKLLYSTYVGGNGYDYGYGIAVDDLDNAYITGYTNSPNFPTKNAYNSSSNGSLDVFVLKLAANGTMQYSTYMSGSQDDQGWGIAVDAAGNVYVTGRTLSNDFPTMNPLFGDTDGDGSTAVWDAFIFKLATNGSTLLYSTYISSPNTDYANAIAVDTAGNAYVTGYTDSPSFPMENAYDNTHNGGWDVFVLKLAPTGDDLVYSTYVGGSNDDQGWAIAVDTAGNAYVTGETWSSDFPITPNAYNDTYSGSWRDVFVCKLTASGMLLNSTYVGGKTEEIGTGITVDTAGNAYVTGYTSSTNFPTTPNAYDDTGDGIFNHWDVFVFKLAANGSILLYSTYVSGTDDDIGREITIDDAGNAYVIGDTQSTDFPTWYSYDPTGDQDTDIWDAVVFKLAANGSILLYSTYISGSADEAGRGITVDAAGNAYITGWTYSTNFPTTLNAFDTIVNGQDVFVCKLTANGSTLLYSTYVGGSDSEGGFGIATDTAGNAYITGTTRSTDFPTVNAYDDTGDGSTSYWDGFVFKLVFDETAPSISLTSPTNNSAVQPGTTIDLTITDDNTGVWYVRYNWDGTTNTSLTAPYDLTVPASEGQHVLKVFTEDKFNNLAIATFVFTTDATAPTITLTSPSNESIRPSGTIVDLTIVDLNGVDQVKYNWDGSANASLTSPYDVTLPGPDGQYVLYVYANDSAGNWANQTYVFTTDDTDPVITLTSPANETIHINGTTIDLSISDLHLISVKYKWDAGSWTDFFTPYDTTLPEGDGTHTLYVNATDAAGHWVVHVYVFTTDDTDPIILLTSPTNETVHHSGTTIDLSISDLHLISVKYKWDGGGWNNFSILYETTLPTGAGTHTLYVNATDEAGNWVMHMYVFTTDDIDPVITLT